MATSYALTSQTFAGWHGTTGQGNTPDIVTLRAAMNTALASVAADRDTQITSNATLQIRTERVPLKLSANATWATYASLPAAATVTSIKLVTPTAFDSTLGAVTLAVKKTSSAGNTMLSAATYDLKSAGDNTSVGITLTSTGADKQIAANGLIYVAVVSNNADATGPADGAACLLINYTLDLS